MPMHEYKTQDTQGFVANMKSMEEKGKLPEEMMSQYCSGIGMLLYPVKLS